jgi:3-hydroxy-3-methylglutaryl CoA synthase
MALGASDAQLRAGDRIGIFSYGSGSCAEFWSAFVCPEASEVVHAAALPQLLDARRTLSVGEYEEIEQARTAVIDSGSFDTDVPALDAWYEHYYAGKRLLIFEGVQDYYRRYRWS